MLSDNATCLYVFISFILSLITNILFFRFAFKKHSKRKANLFAGLSSLGVMLIVNTALYFPFKMNIQINATYQFYIFEMFRIFVTPLISWFLPTAIIVLIRLILIKRFRNEQDAMAKRIEEARSELIGDM